MTANTLTQERLKELLHYDLLTGLFTRTTSGGGFFVGSVAGSTVKGYIRIKISGKIYRAHRLAFLYVLGYIPNEVDHIDHDRGNNKWINLRPVTRIENKRNQPLQNRNRSGFCGVRFRSSSNRWGANIGVNGANVYLGSFKTKESAIKARAAAEVKYGYHPNHGH